MFDLFSVFYLKNIVWCQVLFLFWKMLTSLGPHFSFVKIVVSNSSWILEYLRGSLVAAKEGLHS